MQVPVFKLASLGASYKIACSTIFNQGLTMQGEAIAAESPDTKTPRYGVWITERERRALIKFRGFCYGMLLAYMAIVLVNAVAIVICFLGVAFGWSDLKWQYLASWAGGTTGLGAVSLLFKSVLDYLFGIGRAEINLRQSEEKAKSPGS